MRLSVTSFVFALALSGSALADPAAPSPDSDASRPEHLAQAFLQYGLAFTGEFVVAPGPICSNTGGCILGTGGGLTLRVGRRLRAPFYLGAAYEFAKMESNQLYRLAILQQARAEGRYYIETGRMTEPYLMASAGLAGYGNVWGLDTAGPTFGVGIGTEFQLSTYIVVGLSLSYRAVFLAQFHDGSEASTSPPACNVDPACHPSGFSHLIGIDLVIETRDPF